MAGRPRTTLRRLDQLLQLSVEISDQLLDLTPQCYMERPDAADHVCVGWHLAQAAAMENFRALSRLRELVAAKVERAGRSIDPLSDDNE